MSLCTIETSAFSAESENTWDVGPGHGLEASDQLIETPWGSDVFRRFVGIDSTDDDGVLYNNVHDCGVICDGPGEMFSNIGPPRGGLKVAAPISSGVGQQPPGTCSFYDPLPCEFDYPERVRMNFGGIQFCDAPSGPFVDECNLDFLQSNIFEGSAEGPPQGFSCLYRDLRATFCGESSAIHTKFILHWFGDPWNIFRFEVHGSYYWSGDIFEHRMFSYQQDFDQCPPPTFLEGIFPNQLPACSDGNPSFLGSGGVVLTTWV